MRHAQELETTKPHNSSVPIHRNRRLTLAIVCFSILACLNSALATPSPAVLDLVGRPVNPFITQSSEATVFVFVRTDCPISNRYAPEVRRLHAEFSARGVAFWLVYSDASVTSARIRKHTREFGYSCPVLRDPSHQLVNLCRARVTPEAAVFGPDRHLVYHGRIDDRYTAFGQWRPAPSRQDLKEVLTALLQGDAIPPSEPAIGCAISRAR
jgi:hypothetical protein